MCTKSNHQLGTRLELELESDIRECFQELLAGLHGGGGGARHPAAAGHRLRGADGEPGPVLHHDVSRCVTMSDVT